MVVGRAGERAALRTQWWRKRERGRGNRFYGGHKIHLHCSASLALPFPPHLLYPLKRSRAGLLGDTLQDPTPKPPSTFTFEIRMWTDADAER